MRPGAPSGNFNSGKRRINPLPGGPEGPRITFENDKKGGISPDQPISARTAEMIENAVRESGVNININSTTGGIHSQNSNHFREKAVDINKVNGNPVSPGNDDAKRFQEALKANENIRENFGPDINEKTDSGVTVPRPDQAGNHENHIHAAGQE